MFVNRGSIKTQSYYIDKDPETGDKVKSDQARKANILDHVVTIGLKLKF